MNVKRIPISDDATVTMVRENGVNYVIIKENISRSQERSTRSPERSIFRSSNNRTKVVIESHPVDNGTTTLADMASKLNSDVGEYGSGLLEFVTSNMAVMDYHDSEDAKNAIKNLNGNIYTDWDGYQIQIFLRIRD